MSETMSETSKGPQDTNDLERTGRMDVSTVLEGAEIPETVSNIVFDLANVQVYYGDFQAVRDVTMQIGRNEITAFIGPSGCGKSTLLRSFNRMNDLIPGARVEGLLAYHGFDIYAPDVDPIEVRRRIGMVFQKPNVFPKSIYENVAYGPKVNGMKVNMDDLVEECLTKAALAASMMQTKQALAESILKPQYIHTTYPMSFTITGFEDGLDTGSES